MARSMSQLAVWLVLVQAHDLGAPRCDHTRLVVRSSCAWALLVRPPPSRHLSQIRVRKRQRRSALADLVRGRASSLRPFLILVLDELSELRHPLGPDLPPVHFDDAVHFCHPSADGDVSDLASSKGLRGNGAGPTRGCRAAGRRFFGPHAFWCWRCYAQRDCGAGYVYARELGTSNHTEPSPRCFGFHLSGVIPL